MTGDSALDEALESVRQTYEHRDATLDSIDDKAMRTTRTAVLILGFAAASLTAVGPDSLSDLPFDVVGVYSLGVGCVFAAAFVGIGVYTVTEQRVRMNRFMLEAADRVSRDSWLKIAVRHWEWAVSLLEHEIRKNSKYLEISQLLLLLGSTLLLEGVAVTVLNSSYGVRSVNVHIAVLILGVLTIVVKSIVEWLLD